MSGESVSLRFPFPSLTNESREANALYQELRQPLVRYVVCLGLTADEAQDLVQDAFLSLYRHLSAGGSRENIRGWLFRVAHTRRGIDRPATTGGSVPLSAPNVRTSRTEPKIPPSKPF